MPITESMDGTKIGYAETGSGPLGVVFVHGWSCSGGTWAPVLSHLSNTGRRFVQVDLRGHGNSAADGLEHSVQRYAEDIVAAADAAGLDRFVTVGHSMGGKYAQYVRAIAANRLIGQIAVCPTPSTSVEHEADDQMIATMSANSGDIEGFIGVLAYLTKTPLPDDIVRPLAQEAAQLSREVLAESMRAFATADVTDDIVGAGTPPPTFVIGGMDDPLYSPELLRARIAIENPKASLAVLPSGHDPLHETPRELSLLIEGFLAAAAFLT